MSDKVTWQAVYNDGFVLPQYDDGRVNKYPDIDRTKLERFELLKDGKVFYSLTLNEGQRLIYRRRTLLRMGVTKDAPKAREVIHLIGYQVTVSGKNFVVLNYIYEDGRIELDNSRSNIELYKEEKY
jgi:hypothetical protein